MVTPFEQIKKDATRHQWANYIIESKLLVHKDWEDEAKYLRKYIDWLRGEAKQGSLFNA